MFSIQKTSIVHEKTMTPRSCLRWKLTGKNFKTIGLRWVPTGKIFTSSTTKDDSEPTNGSNEDITNQYECKQTLDVSACTINLSTSTSFNPKKEGLRVYSKLRIHDHNNEPSSSKLVPKVVPPAGKTAISQLELELLFSPTLYSGGGIPFQLKSDSLPHAHAQTTKTYYKHQDSSIKISSSIKDKASYEHVGQDTRSQDGKDDQDKQGKDLKISELKTKSKDNDKGSRSKITQHEGTSLQQDKDQDKDKSLTTKAISLTHEGVSQ
ncbi:hypothetical protein Tco_1492461 [Tanacetum coccineum]